MLLYTVYENRSLRKVTKVDFAKSKVFIIDDDKIIFIWHGLKASKKKKDFSKKKAEILNDKKKKPVKIEIIKQGKEFGSFLTIMDFISKGISGKIKLERRKELKLKVSDTMDLVDAGIDLDLEGEITLQAHKISQKEKSYKELCRDLALLQLKLEEGKKKINESQIKKKTGEIHESSSTYNEICWLIAEMKLLVEKKELDKN